VIAIGMFDAVRPGRGRGRRLRAGAERRSAVTAVALEARGLGKRRGERWVVDEVSFAIAPARWRRWSAATAPARDAAGLIAGRAARARPRLGGDRRRDVGATPAARLRAGEAPIRRAT
jgi:hypothetical protein